MAAAAPAPAPAPATGPGPGPGPQLAVQPQPFRLHNPLVFRAGQVMTGFGVGCGIGIGIGRPLNLGAIPIINQFAGKGDIFQSSGSIGRHVKNLIRRLGFKNVEAGIGCGVGLGHGFGVGFSLKPGTGQQFLYFCENMLLSLARQAKVPLPNNTSMSSFLEGSAKRIGNRNVSADAQTFSSTVTSGTKVTGLGPLPDYPSNLVEQVGIMDQQTRSASEVTKEQVEKEILLTLLRHQRRIEELKDELTALQESFGTHLKVYGNDIDGGLETSKLGCRKENSKATFRLGSSNSCSKCFHCRRRMQRRNGFSKSC